MEDPDWMNDFRTPTEDVLMLSSSSPSSSPSRAENKDDSPSIGKELPEPNGKDESDGDSPLISALSARRLGNGKLDTLVGNNADGKEKTAGRKRKSPVKSSKVAADVEDDDEEKPKVLVSRRSRVGKRALESDEDEGEYKPLTKSRKTGASPKERTEKKKVPNAGRKGRRVSFSEAEEPATLKKVKKENELVEAVASQEDEESAPLSSLKKNDKKLSASQVVGVDDVVVAESANILEKGTPDAMALVSLLDGDSPSIKEETVQEEDALAVTEERDEDSQYVIEEAVQNEEIAEAIERKAKPRLSSTLPVIFADKVHRTKVLLECEGDALDLSGDMGAVGRFSVNPGPVKGEKELLLDLKGIVYKATVVPSNTFFVVNVGMTEAKVEAIMSDFIQLRPDINQVQDETIVEGTLEGYAFDLDNDGEPLSTPVTASGPVDSDADEDGQPKKKTPTKTQKPKKVTAGKGGKGSRSKGNGKGTTAKKSKGKSKGASRKPPKSKPSATKKVKASKG